MGVDLVDFFDGHEELPNLRLFTSSVAGFHPDRTFDLITCVHGLHYVGDKLGLLTRALAWLAPDGLFAANFDLSNVKIEGGSTEGEIVRVLAAGGIDYHVRRRMLSRRGPTIIDFPFRYIGADDHAGPNYTGQPAVNSHYERL